MTQTKKQVILRMSEEKKHLLRIQAAKKNMSVNQYLIFLIEQSIKNTELLTK